MAEIGARIRKARKMRGLTQAQLAARAGIARATLNQFEVGSPRELGFIKVQRLLHAVGLELLVGEMPSMPARDPIELAALAGSTGFRDPLAPQELLRALLTGIPPVKKAPHLRRMLEDSPPEVVRNVLSVVSSWAEPGRVERGLRALSNKLEVDFRDEWTKSA